MSVVDTVEEYMSGPMSRWIRDSSVLPQWLAPQPACRVYHSVNQSVADATGQQLVFDSEDFDNKSMHSTVSNTGLITIPSNGLYLVTATTQWAANAVGLRETVIVNSVAGTVAAVDQVTVGAGSSTEQSVSTVWKALAGENFSVYVFQDSGAALNLLAAANYAPTFSVVRLNS